MDRTHMVGLMVHTSCAHSILERTEKELAELLAIEPKQARAWLKRLIARCC